MTSVLHLHPGHDGGSRYWSSTMSQSSHPHRCQRTHRRRLGLLPLLALTAASPTFSSAFAPPPPPLSAAPLLRSPSSSSFPARRGRSADTRLRMAKKRRRKSAPAASGPPAHARAEDASHGNDASAATDDDDDDGGTPQTTLPGGSPLIFEMARRMLVWDDELYEAPVLNDAGAPAARGGGTATAPADAAAVAPAVAPATTAPRAAAALPRWRPAALRQRSISNANPAFRTAAPRMTNAGYAGILRRNSRKRNKPSLWRHALRTYHHMAALEREAAADGQAASAGPRRVRIRRSTTHHEGALVAASKLGMWEEALRIFREVEGEAGAAAPEGARGSAAAAAAGTGVTENMILSVIGACVRGSKVKRTAAPAGGGGGGTPGPAPRAGVDAADAADGDAVTRDAEAPAVPAPRPPPRALNVAERRAPLDAARAVLLSMEGRHGLPPAARHANPLAAAYTRLGLRAEAAALLDALRERAPPAAPARERRRRPSAWLADRRRRREEAGAEGNPGFAGVKLDDWSDADLLEDGGDDRDEAEEAAAEAAAEARRHVRQLHAKDRASYALLVQGAAMEGDYAGAVRALRRMTEAGLHPDGRDLHRWNEVAERRCRPAGRRGAAAGPGAGGRKKRRDGIWLGNLL